MVKCHKCFKEFEPPLPNSRGFGIRLCPECDGESDSEKIKSPCIRGEELREVIKYNMKNLDWSSLPKIIAVDFDGVLSDGIFPEVGQLDLGLIEILKTVQSEGVKLILWTCRNGEVLQTALDHLRPHITFDAVNTNIAEVIELCGGDTRKVYADIYLDDKALKYTKDTMSDIYRSILCL